MAKDNLSTDQIYGELNRALDWICTRYNVSRPNLFLGYNAPTDFFNEVDAFFDFGKNQDGKYKYLPKSQGGQPFIIFFLHTGQNRVKILFHEFHHYLDSLTGADSEERNLPANHPVEVANELLAEDDYKAWLNRSS